MGRKKETAIIQQDIIESMIYILRGCKVMLDRDLATLYGVKAIRLREQVKRNAKRFPEDFMFQLNKKEAEALVSQNAIPSKKHLGGSLPYVFTEQGVAMLSSVLNSDRAIQVNIAIMRTFTKLRSMIAAHKDLKRQITSMEKKYDKQFQIVFTAIKELFDKFKEPPEKSKGKMGFYP